MARAAPDHAQGLYHTHPFCQPCVPLGPAGDAAPWEKQVARTIVRGRAYRRYAYILSFAALLYAVPLVGIPDATAFVVCEPPAHMGLSIVPLCSCLSPHACTPTASALPVSY